MSRPGDRLRAIAARVCRAKTMERIIDPLVADLQTEYAEAIRQGHVWRSHRVRMAGYVAFWKVIALCPLEGSMRLLHGWTVDDRQAVVRIIAISVAGVGIVTLLMQLPFWLSVPTMPYLFQTTQEVQQRRLAYSVIQAVPFALPVGLMLGVLYGLRGRIVSSRVTMTILVLAVVCSAASFLTLGWILPSATHALRVVVRGGEAANFMKGPGQMTVGELRRQIDAYKATPMAGSRFVRDLTKADHRRWAMSCVALVLALFALSIEPGRRFERVSPIGVVFAVLFGYYLLLWAGANGDFPAPVAAWIPNVVFALGAAAFMVAASRRSEATG